MRERNWRGGGIIRGTAIIRGNTVPGFCISIFKNDLLNHGSDNFQNLSRMRVAKCLLLSLKETAEQRVHENL